MKRGIIKQVVEEHNKTHPTKEQVTVNQVSKRLQAMKEKRSKPEGGSKKRKADEYSMDTLVVPLSPAKKKLGRPKGTTNKEMEFRKEVAASFRDTVTVIFNRRLQLQEEKEMDEDHQHEAYNISQAQHFRDAHQLTLDKFKILYPSFVEKIAKFTIQGAHQRIHRGRLKAVYPGQYSPAAEIEPYLAQLRMKKVVCQGTFENQTCKTERVKQNM